MRGIVVPVALLLLASCGSRQQSVRETSGVEFRHQLSLKDSLEAYMRLDRHTEIDSLSVSVELDTLQRPTGVRVKAHGIRRRDSIATGVAETRRLESADSTGIGRDTEVHKRKCATRRPWVLYTVLTLVLLTVWMKKSVR